MSTEKELLIVIQATNFCNLNCSYCYVPNRQDTAIMSDDILDMTIRKILKSPLLSSFGGVTLCWHAGEPLTVGIEFYKKAIELTEKYNVSKYRVIHNIQTNAVLIDDNWATFFKQNDIRVAVSVDGPDFIHNQSRVTWKGRNTHKQVMKGISTLQRHALPLSCISVVTPYALNYPKEMFDFYFKNQFSKVCFNFEETEGAHETSSYARDSISELDKLITQFNFFYGTFYDLWLAHDRPFEVREFTQRRQSILHLLEDPYRSIGNSQTTPFHTITISKNGDISTFSPELISGVAGDDQKFIMGKISQIHSLNELEKSSKFHEMNKNIQAGIAACANSCQYFNLCGGGAPSNKYFENGTFDSTETMYCFFYIKKFADLMINKMKPKDGLIEGAKLYDLPSLLKNDPDSVQINDGVTTISSFNSSDLLNNVYEENACIPNQTWRTLSRKEQLILSTDIPENYERLVRIVRLPESVIQPIKAVISQKMSTTPNALEFPLSKKNLEKELIALERFLYTHYLFKLDGFKAQELRFNESYMPTGTINKKTQRYAGMHIDNWDDDILENRQLSRNRLCINLGDASRYFLFINLTLNQLFYLSNILPANEAYFKNNLKKLVHLFMEKNPKYPVIKVCVNPGEAYIAPTENMVHDGTFPHQGSLDITWTFLGHFCPK